MDKLVLPIPSNGFPFNNDDIRFFLGIAPYSDGIYQALEGILAAYSSNMIVSGCGVSGSDIAEGWVMLGGEHIKVDAHTATDDYFEKVTTYNATGNKQTQTGGLEDSYQQNRATASASSGTLESTVTGNPDYFPKTKILDFVRNDSDFDSTETNKGVLRIADQTTARAGTNNTEAITALRMLDALRSGSSFAASTTNRGTVEKATTAEVQTGLADRYIDAELLSQKDGGLITSVISIGAWDMVSSSLVTIPHGLTFSKIRSVKANIYNDAETTYEELTGVIIAENLASVGGRASVDSTNITLMRMNNGRFDNTAYNDGVINRGFVIITWTEV